MSQRASGGAGVTKKGARGLRCSNCGVCARQLGTHGRTGAHAPGDGTADAPPTSCASVTTSLINRPDAERPAACSWSSLVHLRAPHPTKRHSASRVCDDGGRRSNIAAAGASRSRCTMRLNGRRLTWAARKKHPRPGSACPALLWACPTQPPCALGPVPVARACGNSQTIHAPCSNSVMHSTPRGGMPRAARAAQEIEAAYSSLTATRPRCRTTQCTAAAAQGSGGRTAQPGCQVPPFSWRRGAAKATSGHVQCRPAEQRSSVCAVSEREGVWVPAAIAMNSEARPAVPGQQLFGLLASHHNKQLYVLQMSPLFSHHSGRLLRLGNGTAAARDGADLCRRQVAEAWRAHATSVQAVHERRAVAFLVSTAAQQSNPEGISPTCRCGGCAVSLPCRCLLFEWAGATLERMLLSCCVLTHF